MPGGLGGLDKSLRKSQEDEAKGAEGATQAKLSEQYENADPNAAADITGPLAGSAVAGRLQTLQSAVNQLLKVAETAAPRDQAGIYRGAVDIVAQAALAKRITAAQSNAETEKVLAAAWGRASDSVTKIMDDNYAAARKGGDAGDRIEANFRGLAAWHKLLRGGDSRPLVRGHSLSELRARVEAYMESRAGQRADPNAVPLKTRFERQGDALVASSLPELLSLGAAAASQIPLIPEGALAQALEGAQAAGGPAPFDGEVGAGGFWARARLVYHRAGSRAAAAFVAKAGARSVWETIRSVISSALALVFPGRVDLGAGQRLIADDRGLSRLAELRRERLSTEEEGLRGERFTGARAVFLDLATLNREADAAERLAAGGAVTVGQLRRLLVSLSRLAGRLERLLGDGSVAAEAAALRLRAAPALALPDDSPLPERLSGLGDPKLPGGPAYWIGRARGAQLDALDRIFESVLRRAGLSAIAYGDLRGAPGASARLLLRGASPAAMAQLQSLGFEIEVGAGGVARAWAAGPGLPQRLRTALDMATAPAPAAVSAADMARAATLVLANPAKARDEAERNPRLRQLPPVGEVTVEGVEYVVHAGVDGVALREAGGGRWLALPAAAGRR